MSFLPKLGPEEFEELFRLFTAAIYQVGISPKGMAGMIDTETERKYGQILATHWIWVVFVVALVIALAPLLQLWLTELWALSQPPN
jgi:hypothetical protein